MIGGCDLAEMGRVAPEDVDVLLRSVRAEWRQGVVENADGGTLMTVQEALREHWTAPCELFLFESKEAYESWSKHGFTEEFAGSTISVSVEPDCLAFVVDGCGSRSHRLVSDAIAAIRNHRRMMVVR